MQVEPWLGDVSAGGSASGTADAEDDSAPVMTEGDRTPTATRGGVGAVPTADGADGNAGAGRAGDDRAGVGATGPVTVPAESGLGTPTAAGAIFGVGEKKKPPSGADGVGYWPPSGGEDGVGYWPPSGPDDVGYWPPSAADGVA